MSRMSSLTETTGVSSPHSLGVEDEGGVGFDEHVDVKTPRTNTPAHLARGLRVL